MWVAGCRLEEFGVDFPGLTGLCGVHAEQRENA